MSTGYEWRDTAIASQIDFRRRLRDRAVSEFLPVRVPAVVSSVAVAPGPDVVPAAAPAVAAVTSTVRATPGPLASAETSQVRRKVKPAD
jgi:hypothetical protein